MLSKAFFAKHANEAVKKRIRESVRAYPAEEIFQENLQVKYTMIYYVCVCYTLIISFFLK
jgi:hypothetical protein